MLVSTAVFADTPPTPTDPSFKPTAPNASRLPDAPEGYQWKPVEKLTDEFDGEVLDSSKWIPRHPSWRGRNSRHEEVNISVSGGHLRLKSTLREGSTDVKASTVTAACVTSNKRRCLPGFYQTRIKASDLSMTSSFWFQGEYSEIDVVENVGRPSLEKMRDIEYKMMMNSHFRNGGWDNENNTPVQWKMPVRARDRFHVYGVWWKDAETLWMYHDGVKIAEIKTKGRFEEPQNMFFDTEVFKWHGWPTRESLLDPARNTMLVDWVRAWKLEKIDAEEK
jgi:beta-glucanase (GH16 family)